MEVLYNLLVVEDDVFMSRVMKKYFERRGFVVYQSFDIGSAFFKSLSFSFDVAIIDINLPSGSSLRSLNKFNAILKCPVIIYTSSDDEQEELTSLECNVADYVNKSRGLSILFERTLRVIDGRMTESDDKLSFNKPLVKIKGCMFDYNLNYISDDTHGLLKLSRQEASLIHYLALQPNTVISKDELHQALYAIPYDGISRKLDLVVSRLRYKLKQKGIELNINTIHGRGYAIFTEI